MSYEVCLSQGVFFQEIMQLHLFNTAEDLRQHSNKYLKGQML